MGLDGLFKFFNKKHSGGPVPKGHTYHRMEQVKPMGKERIKIDLLIHDLKVPLAVIEAGVSSLINRQDKYGPLTEKQLKVLQRALRNVRVTQALVNDALELGRSREGVINVVNCPMSRMVQDAILELFDLNDEPTSEKIKACTELEQLKEILAEKRVFLKVDPPIWNSHVCIDESKVKQILRNLLSNALKYRKETVELEVGKKGTELYISVKDDGEGIPQEYHEKIFQCYFQMKEGGVCSVRGHGLGLAGVMVLVEDMGGKLSLESSEGQGARFSVSIPLKE